jgi:hypothetical protein
MGRAPMSDSVISLAECDESRLENPVRFSLEPALQLGPGLHHAESKKQSA